MTNYASASKRIRTASTEEEINRVMIGLARVHQVGLLTDNQFKRLDQLSVDRSIAIQGDK